jgi:RHS repeat-associated protein
MYMQARYYDPVIGRFYSNDSVDFMGHMQRGNSAAHGFGRYTYANNNPYKYVDPDGELGLIGALIGAGIEVAIQLGTKGEIHDWKAVGIADALGAVTGGVGGRLATQALKGTISGTRATARTAQAGVLANVTGIVTSNAIDGKGGHLQLKLYYRQQEVRLVLEQVVL